MSERESHLPERLFTLCSTDAERLCELLLNVDVDTIGKGVLRRAEVRDMVALLELERLITACNNLAPAHVPYSPRLSNADNALMQLTTMEHPSGNNDQAR